MDSALPVLLNDQENPRGRWNNDGRLELVHAPRNWTTRVDPTHDGFSTNLATRAPKSLIKNSTHGAGRPQHVGHERAFVCRAGDNPTVFRLTKLFHEVTKVGFIKELHDLAIGIRSMHRSCSVELVPLGGLRRSANFLKESKHCLTLGQIPLGHVGISLPRQPNNPISPQLEIILV